MALENSGLPEFQDLGREQRFDHLKELANWLRTYPDNPAGDPNSKFFKPPPDLQRLIEDWTM